MLDENLCWCGSNKKYSLCHKDFDIKINDLKNKGFEVPPKNIIKNSFQIEKIKESSKINIAVLDAVEKNIKIGMSTEDINNIVHETTIKMGGIPATLGYDGFPKSVCTSINDEVCHGIPDENIFLSDGDIINVDASTILDGYFSDSSRMFCIGNVSEKNKQLVNVTKEAIYKGLEEIKPWGFLGDMAFGIQQYIKPFGYNIVKEIGGHGIGLKFHEDPFVSYVLKKSTGMIMAPGMIFTIEPMINIGKPNVFIDEDNGWTIFTQDGSNSAQWEIMILITETGYEILSY